MTLGKLALAGALAGALALGTIATAVAQEASADAGMVVVQGNAFNPPQVAIAAGTTLTWVNNDSEDHDVVPSDPMFSLDMGFFSPAIAPGTTWSYTFTVPGQYDYMCDLHANMYASITVS